MLAHAPRDCFTAFVPHWLLALGHVKAQVFWLVLFCRSLNWLYTSGSVQNKVDTFRLSLLSMVGFWIQMKIK